MGKKLILLTLSLFLYFTVTAQKAKFKNTVCSVQKVGLPSNYVEPDRRTYDLVTKGSYSSDVETYGKKLYGWTLDKENPQARGVVSIYGFKISRARKSSKKKEKKDKDGKVTDKWTEYTYSGSATGLATLYVYGEAEPFKYNSKKSKDDGKKSKSEIKAEEKKKDLADNPFLTNEIIEEAEDSDIGEDAGLESSALPLFQKVNLNQVKNISTKSYRKSSDAYKAYTKKAEAFTDFRFSYPEEAYNAAISSFNRLLGFKPVANRFYLKKMKSDKHPEYKTWNDACQATQTIFKTVKFNQSIDKTAKQMEPIVQYFSDQLTSLSPKDKKLKNHRKAAFNNLLEVLKGLDRHDDVIMWTEKYMKDKKLDGIAKRFKKTSEKIKAHLAFMEMADRHIQSDEEFDEKDIEEGELVEDTEN